MRLTNTMREAFVRAAMRDVPSVDYENKIRDAINAEITKKKKALGLDKVDESRLSYNYVGIEGVRFAANGLKDSELKDLKALPKLAEMAKAKGEQEKSLKALRDKLTGAINACTTRKQAAEALPEFEKYLPADDPKALRSLPALANVAADFVKAGWPKGQKPTTRKPA
jgi:hypothetical protein